MLILITVWGLSVSSIVVGLLVWMLRLTGENVFPVLDIYASFFIQYRYWLVSLFNISVPLELLIALPLFLVVIIPTKTT
ncbi:hypothetical protein [Photorhabdus khanii]|uniref:Uncharacterized protein n=1 Tax=Photorhabdus khanii subsp. guanajuatensis TaxID=2100166 RepID=A0A4R4J489_9GAMM|nr:hypothetical protein [Photorhabdus khanii]TDB47992.1 hypothetical protein C5467_19860 [Photorhabdus khanii subsp. guanajuatensis]